MLDCADWVFNLIGEIERVGVATVRKDDVDQGVGDVVCVRAGAVKSVFEVAVWIGNLVLTEVTAKDDKASDRDTG